MMTGTSGHSDSRPAGAGQLRRLQEQDRDTVPFLLDGEPCDALAGDTVLTAILMQARRLRDNEFTHTPRAGFCLMGACQDCLVWVDDGQRIRACSTLIRPGMRLRTAPPALDDALQQTEPA
jgi:predicted molibdopterin-dependent oxidoreductase YjgC